MKSFVTLMRRHQLERIKIGRATLVLVPTFPSFFPRERFSWHVGETLETAIGDQASEYRTHSS